MRGSAASGGYPEGMSTIKRPVGPQPSKVYRRRRLLVVLGLIAVLVVVILIIVRPGSGAATPRTAPTQTSSSKASKPSTPVRTTIPTAAAQADGAPCRAANVAVDALTDKDVYAPGEQPQLSLALTNTGSASCTINAGTSQQVYTVTSGTEVYWKSTDCQTNPVDTVILLLPGKKVTSHPITWDRTRSDPSTCAATRVAAPATGASYHVSTSVNGIVSKQTKQFILN